jgi:hypothetical protein
MNSTHLQPYNFENVDHEIFWNEFQKIVSVLQSDLDEIEKHLNNDDSQIWRRTYYRTFFAYLEGQAHALKQLFLFYDWWTVDLDTEYKIRNQKRIQNKDGAVKVIESYLPLVQNIKLLFKAFAIASGIEPIVSDDDESWKLLAKAASVRNRIVHPKKSEDLVITNEEIRLIKYVGGWFLSNSAQLLKKRVQSDIKTIKAMRESARKQFGLTNEPLDIDSLIEEFEDDE